MCSIQLQKIKRQKLFLLGDTDSLASAAGGLCVLTTDSNTPIVSETTVSADLLEAFQILTELVVQEVGHDLAGLACD